MRNVLFFMICLRIFISGVYAQQKPLPGELVPFVAPGKEMLDFTKADLNGDGRSDYVLILKTAGEDTLTFDNSNWDAPRPLLLLTRQADNKLKLAVANHELVLCRHCGGAMGDPFMELVSKPGEFTLEFYGGSSWKWGQTITFRYDKLKRNWYLYRDIVTGSHPEGETYVETMATIERQEIGDIALQQYNPNYNQDTSRRQVTAAKTYFYESPEVKSKPRKGYVLRGDIVKTYKQFRNFVECTYTSSSGAITTGYLLKKDLEVVRK
jgi:hypothetical protein